MTGEETAKKKEEANVKAARRQLPKFCNAAAMRVALKEIHDMVNSLDEECGVDPIEVRDIARAALSTPPRNCDRFTTPEEAMAAYRTETSEDRRNPEVYWPCLFDWLFSAPEAEGKEAAE